MKNGLNIRQKYSVFTRILKKRPSKCYSSFTAWPAENLHKNTSEQCKKFSWSGILNFSFFAIYSPKTAKIAIFTISGTLMRFKQQKNVNSKIRSHQFFCILLRYLNANFQLLRSNNEWGVAFLRFFLLKLWSKHCIFGQFFALMANIQLPIKSELLRVRKSVSTFWNQERQVYDISWNEGKGKR